MNKLLHCFVGLSLPARIRSEFTWSSTEHIKRYVPGARNSRGLSELLAGRSKRSSKVCCRTPKLFSP